MRTSTGSRFFTARASAPLRVGHHEDGADDGQDNRCYSGAAGPNGSDQPEWLHRGGEGPHLADVPRSPATRGARPRGHPALDHRWRAAPRRHRLHPRGGGPQSRAADRHGGPQGGGEDRHRGARTGDGGRKGSGRVSGPGTHPIRERVPDVTSRSRNRRGVDRGRRRRALHRGRAPARGQRADHPDRPARGSDAGVGPRRAVAHPPERQQPRDPGRVPEQAGPPRPRPGGRDSEGRPVGRCDDGDGDGVGGARRRRSTPRWR